MLESWHSCYLSPSFQSCNRLHQMTLLVSFHSSSRQVSELCEYIEFPSIAFHNQTPSQRYAAYVDGVTVLKTYERSDKNI